MRFLSSWSRLWPLSSWMLLVAITACEKRAVVALPAVAAQGSVAEIATQSKEAQKQSLRVMFWNAENLYDLVDDPATSDQNWLPGGREQWSEQVLSDKIANLGEVIRAEKPDVLGLVEIESQLVIDRLMREGMKVEYPTHMAQARGDARGIRAGFISRFPTVETRSHQVWTDGWINERGQHEVTRDILEITLDTGAPGAARYVTFLVNHWPSRSGGAIRVGWRKEAAAIHARRTAEILAANPDRLVISMGDYNDELTDEPLTMLNLLPAGIYRGQVGLLQYLAPGLELTSQPLASRGTYYYHGGKVWNVLDNMLIAEGDALKSGQAKSFEYRKDSFAVIRHRFEDPTTGIPYNCSTYDRRDTGDITRCLKGAADHRPIRADFDL